jgi:hypothetical protein
MPFYFDALYSRLDTDRLALDYLGEPFEPVNEALPQRFAGAGFDMLVDNKNANALKDQPGVANRVRRLVVDVDQC